MIPTGAVFLDRLEGIGHPGEFDKYVWCEDWKCQGVVDLGNMAMPSARRR